jgi:hypothetical protein
MSDNIEQQTTTSGSDTGKNEGGENESKYTTISASASESSSDYETMAYDGSYSSQEEDSEDGEFVQRGWNVSMEFVLKAMDCPVGSVEEYAEWMASKTTIVRGAVQRNLATWIQHCSGHIAEVTCKRRLTWARMYLSKHTLASFLNFGNGGLILPMDTAFRAMCAAIKHVFLSGILVSSTASTYDKNGDITQITWAEADVLYKKYCTAEQQNALNLGYSWSNALLQQALTGKLKTMMGKLPRNTRRGICRKIDDLLDNEIPDTNKMNQRVRTLLVDDQDCTLKFNIVNFKIIMDQAKDSKKNAIIAGDKSGVEIKDLREIIYTISPDILTSSYMNPKKVSDLLIPAGLDYLNCNTLLMTQKKDVPNSLDLSGMRRYVKKHRRKIIPYEAIFLDMSSVSLPAKTVSSVYNLIERASKLVGLKDGRETRIRLLVFWNMASLPQSSLNASFYAQGFTQLAINSPVYAVEFFGTVSDTSLIPVFNSNWYEKILKAQLKNYYKMMEYAVSSHSASALPKFSVRLKHSEDFHVPLVREMTDIVIPMNTVSDWFELDEAVETGADYLTLHMLATVLSDSNGLNTLYENGEITRSFYWILNDSGRDYLEFIPLDELVRQNSKHEDLIGYLEEKYCPELAQYIENSNILTTDIFIKKMESK